MLFLLPLLASLSLIVAQPAGLPLYPSWPKQWQAKIRWQGGIFAPGEEQWVHWQYDYDAGGGYQAFYRRNVTDLPANVQPDEAELMDFKKDVEYDLFQFDRKSAPTCRKLNSMQSWGRFEPTYIQRARYNRSEVVKGKLCAVYSGLTDGFDTEMTVWLDEADLRKGTFTLLQYTNPNVLGDVRSWGNGAAALDTKLWNLPTPCCSRPFWCLISSCTVLNWKGAPNKCSYDYCQDDYCSNSCSSYKLFKDGVDVTAKCSVKILESEVTNTTEIHVPDGKNHATIIQTSLVAIIVAALVAFYQF